jgi:hypothetical protein
MAEAYNHSYPARPAHQPDAKGTGLAAARCLVHFPVRWLHPSRRAQVRAPQDEVLDSHGEERGKAARLEPRGRRARRLDSTIAEDALEHARKASVRPHGSRFL